MLKPIFLFCVLGLAVTLLSSLGACRQENKVKPSNELNLHLPNDLEATLWAETPLFYNPTNIDVDAKGRVWVAEAVNYRNYNNDSTQFLHHPQGDRIMILEDTDQDGIADSAKVFVQDRDLVSPVGLAVIGNKVIVSCSPNLIIYTDENGDDVPDKKEILLTGFGGRDHDHSLHAVIAGPDGNWYFNTGNAGPHIVKDKSGWTLRSGSIYTGGSPYNQKNEGNLKSDDGKVWVGGLALRIKPDGTGLKVMGHNFRNSYELTTDSYGNMWQNDNDDQVVTCRTTWLMEGGNAGYFSSDGTRNWEADQRPGQDIFTAHWHQEDPGVMPAGDRTGAGAPTGIVMNESDVLGPAYRGMLLSADAGRNTIFSYHPSPFESGWSMGVRNNFLSSLSEDNPKYEWNDSAQNAKKEMWFRPSDVAIGTDGAIYVADWYDPIVGGHQMKDREAYGRIYRIAPKNKKLASPKYDFSNIRGQLEAFNSPAINVRNFAFEKLKEQGENAVDPVADLLKSENRFLRARAIWLLSQLGEKGKRLTEQELHDPDPQMRFVAFRALRNRDTNILPFAQKLAEDSSACVRREVAIALRDIPFKMAIPVMIRLIEQFNGNDRWYLEALGAVMQESPHEYYPVIMSIFGNTHRGEPRYQALVSLLWRLHPVEALPFFLSRANDTSLPNKERMDALTAIGFMKEKTAALAMIQLAKSHEKIIAEMASYWLSFRQGNDWYALLDWKNSGVNTAYEKKLAAMKLKRQRLLDEDLPSNERTGSARAMAKDSVGGQMLIGLAAENKLPKAVFETVQSEIFNNPDLTVRVQAGKYFKSRGAGKSYSIEEITSLPRNAIAGKLVFQSRCTTCHRAGNEGNRIGPDLSLIRKKLDRVQLLDAIINPSAGIAFGYEPLLINTIDGESVLGFLVSENKQTLVIRDASGALHTLPLSRISSRKKQETSLMPDPSILGLSDKDLANLAEYLLGLKG